MRKLIFLGENLIASSFIHTENQVPVWSKKSFDIAFEKCLKESCLSELLVHGFSTFKDVFALTLIYVQNDVTKLAGC